MSSKRKSEKLRKEEQDTARVFQDFIETFQSTPTALPSKQFIRSEVLYSDNKTQPISKLYAPKPLIKPKQAPSTSHLATAIECAKILKPNNLEKSKHKSNLDELKEELKLRHTEKVHLLSNDTPDPTSTNLFITNLNSDITERQLMRQFGAYGPLASVKIMRPRNNDKFRSSFCGFVAFMSRKDAERALKYNQHREDMKVSWGKAIEIAQNPVYIPEELLRVHMPPRQTGLPFNAQVPRGGETSSGLLRDCVVKVTIPLNKKLLSIVHRMVEFVVREGPMFEAVIMNREINNPDYSFLFDYRSPVHIYYRWKLFSVLNGDSLKTWSTKPFRMFVGGSIWLPPVVPDYTSGMPEELIKDSSSLSNHQRDKMIDLIRNVTMARDKISEAMCFCISHACAINECLEVIVESLINKNTCPLNKIARLYLLSDVLVNCKIKKIEVDLTVADLMSVFGSLHEKYNDLRTSGDKQQFKMRITKVLQSWDIHNIFPRDVLKEIEKIFIDDENDDGSSCESTADEPLDGASLLKRSKGLKGAEVITIDEKEVVSKEKREVSEVRKAIREDMSKYFVPSKWNELEPGEVDVEKNEEDKERKKRNKKKKRHHKDRR